VVLHLGEEGGGKERRRRGVGEIIINKKKR
jgi:hypothetical protein